MIAAITPHESDEREKNSSTWETFQLLSLEYKLIEIEDELVSQKLRKVSSALKEIES